MPSAVAGLIGWVLPGLIWNTTLFGSPSTDAFIFACIPVIYFYASLYSKAAKEEKQPILALLAIFAVVILFWAVFKQNGSALNTWADRYTNREVKGTTQKVFETLRLSQTLVYAKDSVPLYDEQFRLQKEDGKIIRSFDYPSYFKNMERGSTPQPGGNISVWVTNLSQSINPGWVIIFTPLVVAFFTWLRKRNREPTTATKIAWGLFISGLSALVMVGAVYAGHNGVEKASTWWLIAGYGVITVGELFLSPMGLSIVSKLSPPRITALMMGGWFLSTSIGNKLSGVLATLWDGYDHKANYFLLNFALLMAAAVVCFAMLRWLNAVLKAKGVN
jgi:POT family proton-dependent oligopeptide transporter